MLRDIVASVSEHREYSALETKYRGGGQEGSNVTTGCGGERERRKRCARREGSRHLLEARALVSGGCSCSASDSALVLLPAAAWRFNFRHEALTSPCHRTKNMARCTRANIHPSGVPLRPLFSAGTRCCVSFAISMISRRTKMQDSTLIASLTEDASRRARQALEGCFGIS